MKTESQDDLGFTYQLVKSGAVLIDHHGKLATTLRTKKALDFIAKIESLDFAGQQQWMARLTGNYKRGNEHQSKKHPRNR